MSDNYNIKLSVDGRSAERGVKSFTGTLNSALKTLKEFDTRSKNAFAALSKLGNANMGGLAKSARSTAQALETLNRVKINKQLINNLQMLQRALAMRFNADSLRKVPEILNMLSRMKIDTRFVSTLNEIKNALKGFRGPPAAIDKWRSVLNAFSRTNINGSLPNRIRALTQALSSTRVPASLGRLPSILKQISGISISPTIGRNMMALNAAMQGFRGPSAAAVKNLQSLLITMSQANAGKISQVAGALSRLNGLSLNIGRGLSAMGRQGANNFTQMGRGIANTTSALRGMGNQMSITTHIASALATSMGAISLGTMIKGIYETGNAFVRLDRTLNAIATTSTEVKDHMEFLTGLTTRMPVSLEAAAQSYGKFAVAARLAGVSAKDTQRVFEGFSTGFAAMGVAAENQKYAFLALEQIFSKGTVQMEELRVQLGDHLPAAVQILAQSMGVSTAKLMKMIEAGEVTSDVLIKMSDQIKKQFGPALAAAMDTSQAQIVNLQNQWALFKKTIFDSGFNAGLGAMAKAFSNALNTKDMQSFAERIGAAFGKLFTTVGALGNLIAENKDKVIAFMKAFAGWMAIYSIAAGFNLLLAPFRALGPATAIAAAGFTQFGGAIKAIATGTAIASIGKFFTSLTGKVVIAAAAITGITWLLNKFLELVDSATGSQLAVDFGALATQIGSGLGNVLEAAGNRISKAIGFDDAMKDADEYFKTVQKGEHDWSKQQEANAKREAEQAAAKAKALTEAEQKVWDEVNAIGKANSEYNKQLVLIDSIAKKRGMSAEQTASMKKVLEAQTLDERNPTGALVRDHKEELAAMKAKTGEARALLDAQKDYNELLKKGQDIGKEGLDALKQYHEGIARMNGEIGSGIERWSAKVGDFNDQMQNAIADGIDSLSDEITNFVTGAEADFAGMARSILKSFVKISLDSMLKDMFGAMGLDGAKNGEAQANKALEKLANIGENITTAMTNVYTDGLNINGVPATAPGTSPTDQISRTALPDVPGSSVGGRLDDQNTRFDKVAESAGVTGATAAAAVVGGGAGGGAASSLPAMTASGLAEQYGQYGAGKAIAKDNAEAIADVFDKRWGGQGAAISTATSGRVMSDTGALTSAAWDYKQQATAMETARVNGIVASQYAQYGAGKLGTGVDTMRTGSTNPMLDLIGRAEGTDRGRGYNETLGYGAFTGGDQNLTGMTLGQIDKLQTSMLAHPDNNYNSSALGRYQITRRTLRDYKEKMGLDDNQLFDAKLQDQIAEKLIARRGRSSSGLRSEWEGLKKVSDDELLSTYDKMGAPRPKVDVPGAYGSGFEKIDGLNWNGSMRNGTKGLTMHHTGGNGTPQDVIKTLNERAASNPAKYGNLGAQYIMDKEGNIFQAAPDGARVSHMRPGQGMGAGLDNSNTIGMEVIGANDAAINPKQIAAGQAWINQMRQKYPEIGNNVFGHGEINSHKQETEGTSIVNAWRQSQGMPTNGAATAPVNPLGIGNSGALGGVSGIDPATTGYINTLKTQMTSVGQAAQTAAQPFQQMNTTLTQTGTAAQTSATQTQTANSMKSQAEMMASTQTQMAGTNIQMAGTNAATAGPQFQQAGAAMASAGQQASMAGTQAQSATGGVGGFGDGLSQLMGPLMSAIPGLGQFGGMIMQLVQSLFSGGGMGGGLGAGLFKEGGFSNSPVSSARVGAGVFANAPHFKDGTANTSGGIPAVLHDNEAVIPLSRGRKVPVEMSQPSGGHNSNDDRRMPEQRRRDGGVNIHFHGVKDADTFKKSRRQIMADVGSAQYQAMLRD